MKTKETNNLTCFLLNPRLSKHVITQTKQEKPKEN